MKHCPTCNTNFVDDDLGYCTDDGTVLVPGDASSSSESQPTRIFAEAPPTMAMPPPRKTEYRVGAPANQPQARPPYQWANESPPAWTPPAPPIPYSAIRQQPQQTMAIVSLVFGIAAITFGWICGGPAFGLLAVILGLVALSQIKRNPVQYGGKPMALGGLITGGIVLLFYLALVVIWIVVFIIGAASR